MEPFVTLDLTEQQAVDLLNLVDAALGRDYPEEDSFNPSMRAIRDMLAPANDSDLLPGGLEPKG